MLAGGVKLKRTCAPQKIKVYSNKYYDQKIKHDADDAIKKEHITNRGPKLNKHRKIMHCMYSDESEVIKAKINKKYEAIKARYTKQCECLKSGKPPKIDNMSKIKAIHKLGPMLDRVLKYLGHMTGGWKFSVLMGGHDPSTGEMSVFNYHMGEVESGAQFHQAYDKFDIVQSTFLDLSKSLLMCLTFKLAFESTLTRESDDGLLLLDPGSDEEWGKSSGEGGQSQVQEDPGNYLYCMTPQSDEGAYLSPNTVNASPAGHATTTSDAPFSDASFGFDSQAATARLTAMDHMDLSVLDPSLNDPIVQGSIDFSAFDPAAFSAVINDPTFDINMLDSPKVSPMNSHPDVQDHPYSPIPQTLEVFLPSVHNEEGENTNDFNKSPTVPHARRRNHFNRTQAPAPSAQQQVPHLCAHNNVPFNPHECDNEIGTSTHHPPTSVAAKEGRNDIRIIKNIFLNSACTKWKYKTDKDSNGHEQFSPAQKP
ncbi:hypothetical protein BDR05DRAFT_950989 [Suillus weaverae]|nr:hypothetical protein BDR05DRAFT_950989 [Suillus weaverae]